MCGRFALSAPSAVIRKHFGLSEEVVLPPRYNVAPGQDVALVLETKGNKRLVMMRWGLIPFWAKESKIGYKMINARSETLHEKPSFKTLINTSRCLIPASGFYEWQHLPEQQDKQPHFITMRNELVFSFAGLWSTWTNKASGEYVESCTIITTEPNALMANIHNRMPVIVPQELYSVWLGEQSRQEELKRLFVPYDPDLMTSHPVSTFCNNPKNDSPKCIEYP